MAKMSHLTVPVNVTQKTRKAQKAQKAQKDSVLGTLPTVLLVNFNTDDILSSMKRILN